MPACAAGASISWISQYPSEQEILFPPLTALETTATRVEGTVIVVELAASMRAPEIQTGWEDLQRLAREREASAKREEQAIVGEIGRLRHHAELTAMMCYGFRNAEELALAIIAQSNPSPADAPPTGAAANSLEAALQEEQQRLVLPLIERVEVL